MPETIVKIKFDCTLIDLPRVAAELLDWANGQRLWLFYGNLGSGKTTLIKELGKRLGVHEKSMSSPTYSIINEYRSASGTVFHFDFYRMKSELEILDLGIEEYFDSGNYCFIEWPERLGALMPTQYFKVSITENSTENRTIEYQNHV